MAIKNYTSDVSAYKSLGEIQEALASHGARHIIIEYSGTGNRPVSVMFDVETPDGRRVFCLPANVEGVKAVFTRQKIRADDAQVERTAWRNVRDWILAQMAIVEAGMVQVEEVFLPYMTDGSGRTLFQTYKANGGYLALPEGEKGEI